VGEDNTIQLVAVKRRTISFESQREGGRRATLTSPIAPPETTRYPLVSLATGRGGATGEKVRARSFSDVPNITCGEPLLASR
jgi:hypothetical protein